MRRQTHAVYAVWLLVVLAFAALHAMHLRADFPNHSPWFMDWAKYTDEGWYGNAAIRAHLFGSWYLRGDFNPAPAVPVWPFLEWLLFFFTGVSPQAARGLAVAVFFCNLLLSYLLLRTRGPRWMAMLALTLIVTSPFLYCFSRLAILEPTLITFTLAALNLAVRLPQYRRPRTAALCIGVLFTLMMLSKTTAIFLLPALGWAIIAPLWRQRQLALRCAVTAMAAFGLSFGLWLALVAVCGHMADFNYLFFVNKYPKPTQADWPVVSLWWSFHGGLWIDKILIPMAGFLAIGAAMAWWSARKNSQVETSLPQPSRLFVDPLFGASLLAVAGYILFMTSQDHPQPRYFSVMAFFCFFIVAQGIHAMLAAVTANNGPGSRLLALASYAILALTAIAVGVNGAQTLNFSLHPEYTFVNAATALTNYIDTHPNGKRLLACVSGDEITLVTHLPAVNDLYVTPGPETPDLARKLGYYNPGWYASWNTLDPGMLEDIHSHYFVEQVATFPAFDDPTRNVLVLFKLHPWPDGRVLDPADQNLQVRFPEDRFEVPLE